MSGRLNLQDEIRRITNETAASAASKALEVADQAKQRAAEVSSLAIAKALDASTLAAEKAAAAAAAAASVATATNLDLTYIKKDIAETKADIKSINEKLDDKFVSKIEFMPVVTKVNEQASIVSGIQKYVWLAIGGLAVFQFITVVSIPILLFIFKA